MKRTTKVVVKKVRRVTVMLKVLVTTRAVTTATAIENLHNFLKLFTKKIHSASNEPILVKIFYRPFQNQRYFIRALKFMGYMNLSKI